MNMRHKWHRCCLFIYFLFCCVTSWAFFTLRISRHFSDGPHWTPLGEVRSSRPAMLRPGVWPWRRWCIGRMPQKWRQPSAPCVLRVAGDGSWVHQLQEMSWNPCDKTLISVKPCFVACCPRFHRQYINWSELKGLLGFLQSFHGIADVVVHAMACDAAGRRTQFCGICRGA